ncbi:MAG: GatB/YqeY domain-containing protein [Bacillota bacterium]|uniref:GatB/YqeY domain-containing protein n=1 Tax=Virgibacillus salarius TaxID=447199 RepID=A0A941E1V8_9BACI|nr:MULTISPECIES: GatB/YqeY domain-containing protein [Bacillaceae]NAZ10901.1 GatB/YqeY domain-containing protein [Agaribacter marinus]MBR7798193.1 GatB/YqeY domain-containing protein [Virgibacillus salarius]MCC2252281.1 GatB/YqeY domain-containing protein [Virgibacillus sp. AGTR]MDY7046332.1 GatB/YqeY domain-containing protein [Virgibacillus sp. M23]QRZ17457.1 GatB/YqeY domain-containing protein [Virgibacillus sp. AGTR]
MTLLENLNQDMKQAMKNKDKETLSVIRMVKASIQNESIKLGKDSLSEDEETTILSREVKQRKDSLQEFKSAGREDLVQKLENEINILQEYMPAQLTDDELEAIVQSTIHEVNATSMKDMGKVMSAIMPKVKGQADGSQINKLVQKQLRN